LFWKPEYQRHPNGALRVVRGRDVRRRNRAASRLLGATDRHAAELAPGQLKVGTAEDRITVLDRSETLAASRDRPRTIFPRFARRG